jgi:hypothetical protein
MMGEDEHRRAEWRLLTGPGGSWLTRSAAALGRTIESAHPRVPEWITMPTP